MNSKKVCHCFGAGDFYGLCAEIDSEDMIIAADGGLKAAESCHITPHCIIGDFDSLGSVPNGENIRILPCEKDTTDMFEAVNAGLEMGCKVFHLYGGTGGRLDHTIANIQLLKYFAEKGAELFLYGKDFAITALNKDTIRLNGKAGCYVSVFALSDIVTGVTIKNLKYELSNHTLANSFPLGVSNEFTDKTAEISVGEGTLAVYYTKGND